MFVNGQKLDGAVPEEEVRLALDQALKDAGVAPPEHKRRICNLRFVICKLNYCAISADCKLLDYKLLFRRLAVVAEGRT